MNHSIEPDRVRPVLYQGPRGTTSSTVVGDHNYCPFSYRAIRTYYGRVLQLGQLVISGRIE